MVTQVAPSVQTLVEAGGPPWAQRMALRLQQFFQPQRPIQPTRLWRIPFAEFPPAADWPGGQIGTPAGELYVSDGATWLKVGPGATGVPEAPNDGTLYGRKNLAWAAVPPPGIADAPNDGSYYSRRNLGWAVPPAPPPTTTAPTQPQSDQSTLIANTDFVHSFGPNLASVTFYGASATLPAVGGPGRLHVFNAAGVTLTMPLGSLLWQGATYWIQNATAGALNINMGAGDAVYRVGAYVTTLALASGKGVALMRSGPTDWYTWGDVL